ncbi:redoxin domain-containing protein [Pokkaliibacter sp. MBI-7]|uniref:glutathione peroxidase n=1 Tax=Pokkaliibacter sp. MBI-7 TaxID=3040600 RepID=UPI00244C62E7|nr:redoxin domain-containing protein [Pokkaliibacter sp. MBI-7]MDH2434411.1 redoxin domain-containing protein [Pokkaliibacter sp. MBI-7]
MSDLYTIPVNTIKGEATTLESYKGKVLLVVNVASKCGLTKQYEGLEKLYKTYQERGFEVLGFPANDFKGQEPGTDEEIQQFCTSTYEVTFPMFSKLVATGADKHPLYAYLTSTEPHTVDREAMETMLRGYQIEPTAAPEVVWNFEKFVIGRDGHIAARLAPGITPDSAAITEAVEAELAKA